MGREYKLSNEITEDMLVEFDLFVVKDSTSVNEPILLKNLETSDSLLNFILRQHKWFGMQYYVDGSTFIGYGTKASDKQEALTEAESYSLWLADLKEKERAFKRVLPLEKLTQTQYDSLFSLFYHTGSIAYVGTETRKFYILDYIKNGEWQYVATALINAGNQRLIRQQEASIMMLADYGSEQSRTLIKENGLQFIRKNYPNNLDATQAAQAELVYYKETNRFLPKTTHARKRQIVSLTK